jgi:hypothetical protein
MLFAFAEDGVVWVLEHESDAKVGFEPIDVENGVFIFYAEDGTWLEPRFIRPNKRKLFGLVLEQGEYELVRGQAAEADAFEVALSEARAIEPNLHFKTIEEIRRHVERIKSGQ